MEYENMNLVEKIKNENLIDHWCEINSEEFEFVEEEQAISCKTLFTTRVYKHTLSGRFVKLEISEINNGYWGDSEKELEAVYEVFPKEKVMIEYVALDDI